MNEHAPVLLKETLKYLDVRPQEVVLDATVDGGGHAIEILKQIGEKGFLVGIEQDEEILKNLNLAYRQAGSQISNLKSNVILINGNFRDLDKLLAGVEVKKVDAALFDLGMSSLQLENSKRGFTFQKDEPLLMTFKSLIGESDLTAKEILNSWPEKAIAEILKEYGEERYARRIAKKIFEIRRKRKFETTFDLVNAVSQSVPVYYKRRRLHFATKTFQALRITVNDELAALEEGLKKSWEILNKKGRIAVISFHSLEDRIVKNFFREKKNKKEGMILTKRPIFASFEETKSNPRARSAKLRVIIKI